LILVRESWGAQLIARLWGLGVSRSEAEALYRSVDTCLLEEAIVGIEGSGLHGETALERLRPLTRDSLQLIESTLSPDKTERVLPGATYSPLCQKRVIEDRGGILSGAAAGARASTNIYARDLHARDTLLLRRYQSRPAYVLRATSSDVGAPLMLEPLRLDSARAEWVGVPVR
jgi:hypothetical protein